MAWPKDTQSDLIRFYGVPGRDIEQQLVTVIPPFRLTYEGKPVRSIRFHRKAAPALCAIFDKIWKYYGKDQKTIDRLGISKFAGTYNPRKISGSKNWSNHAFGAAIDLNASENGFNTGHGTMPLPVVAAFKSEGFRWGGDYKGRTDPMHFEACESGQPTRTFEQWLAFYKCPPPANAKPAPPPPDVEPVPAPKPTQPDDPGPNVPPVPDTDPEIREAKERGFVAHLKRRWKEWTVGGIGGGLTIGGITLNAETIYALCAFLGALTVAFLIWIYLVPPRGQINKGL